MQTIVVYESATGFTKKYAEWTSEALGCECRPLKGVTTQELAGFDRVIFGGWVMGGNISGLNKLRSMTPAPAAVFAVGSTPCFDEVMASMRILNKLEDTPFFYMTGGFRFEKLGFAKRFLLNSIKKATAKKESRSRQEDFMAQTLGSSFDHSQKEQTTQLVEFIRGL